jgi:hypothetical protein
MLRLPVGEVNVAPACTTKAPFTTTTPSSVVSTVMSRAALAHITLRASQ